MRWSRSNYVVSYGKDWMFPPNCPDPQTHPDVNKAQADNGGPFMMTFGRDLHEFVDGTSKTIIASEVRAGQDDDYYTWPAVADVRGCWFSPFMATSGYLHLNTPNSSVPDLVMTYHCNDEINATAPCSGSATWQSMNVAARSYHPGGVNVVFADGHVGFYSDSVDLELWQALSTIAGSEVIGQQDNN